MTWSDQAVQDKGSGKAAGSAVKPCAPTVVEPALDFDEPSVIEPGIEANEPPRLAPSAGADEATAPLEVCIEEEEA